jgi:hypothetical protein
MKHLPYLSPLLLLALGACSQYGGMMGQGPGPGAGPGPGMATTSQAQHTEHMKTMQDHMSRMRATTDPAARQKMMDEHMKMMDDHMARMQNMPCAKM